MENRMMTRHDADKLARGLGWFSIALGITELLAPRLLARALGMQGHETLLRACGLREVFTGVGILTAQDCAPWIWGRVAGDALDIATLATCSGSSRHERRLAIAYAALASVTALDYATARGLRPVQPAAFDYSDRSGFPEPPDAMRGRALRDFASRNVPPDAVKH